MSLTSPNPFGSRATATISAPASASTRQISRPIPLEAPVTSAFLPSSEKRLTNSAIASPSGRYDFQPQAGACHADKYNSQVFDFLVRTEGIEPSRAFAQRILSPL